MTNFKDLELRILSGNEMPKDIPISSEELERIETLLDPEILLLAGKLVTGDVDKYFSIRKHPKVSKRVKQLFKQGGFLGLYSRQQPLTELIRRIS